MDPTREAVEGAPRDRNLVGSVLKAANVLNVFSGRRTELSALELAEATGYPRPTVHRLLMTMQETGWVARSEAGLWTLGPGLFRLGSLAANSFDIRRTARPFLAALASRTGDSSYLFVMNGERTLCLDRILGPGSIKVSMVDVGQSLPPRRGAASRVIEAFAHGMTPPDGEPVLPGLREVYEHGYDLNLEELAAGVSAVSAPLFNQTGKAIAAVSLAGLRDRFAEDRMPDICREVVATAREVSRSLGYVGHWPWDADA